MSGEREQALTGGDVTVGVVRVGNTVRRPIGHHSNPVHAFLRYLENTGFAGAPRFLGIDEQGREVLSFIDGEVPTRPLEDWVLDEDVLQGIAALLRQLHDCAAGFTLPAGVEWPAPFDIPGVPLPFSAPDIVGHNDVIPQNVVFRSGMPVAFIDFDLAGPTTRLHDLVATMRPWAPLLAPEDREERQQSLDAGRRMRVLRIPMALMLPKGRSCSTSHIAGLHEHGTRCATERMRSVVVGSVCGQRE